MQVQTLEDQVYSVRMMNVVLYSLILYPLEQIVLEIENVRYVHAVFWGLVTLAISPVTLPLFVALAVAANARGR